MADNNQPQEPLTKDDIAALQAWSNVGSSGAVSTIPFTPNDEQKSKLQAIKSPRTITVDWDFDLDSYEKLKLGHHAQEMEDKWNIYLEDNVVHFHRSWTGNELFRFVLSPMNGTDGEPKYYHVGSFEAEQDPEAYKETDEQAIKDMLGKVLRFVLGMSPVEKNEKQASSHATQPERTANPTEIADEVAGFLDYVNVIRDANTLIWSEGKRALGPKCIIDEAQSPAKEITGGLAYYVFRGEPTGFRYPIIGANKAHPRPSEYVVVRTHSKNPENEQAPYLQPFWVEVPHGSELDATVDDNYAHRIEPEVVSISQNDTPSTSSGKHMFYETNKQIIDLFAPKSQYVRLPWIPSKRFPHASNVMFAYRRKRDEVELDKRPAVWFVQDYKSNMITAAGLTSVIKPMPDFKSDKVEPPTVVYAYEQATDAWNKHIVEITRGYFDDSDLSLSHEEISVVYLGLSAIIPPEYFAWYTQYHKDFLDYLSRQFNKENKIG